MTPPLSHITYSVTPSGIITAVSEPTWARFAGENRGGPVQDPTAVVGRPLFDFIAGQEVIASYKAIHEVLLQGLLPEVSILCHCDAPDRLRLQEIKIEIDLDAPAPTLRYTSSILEEKPRQSVALLQGPASRHTGAITTLTVCSYCMDVHIPPGAASGLWISLTAYAAQGGVTEAAISHGICPPCRARIVNPMLARLRERRGKTG